MKPETVAEAYQLFQSSQEGQGNRSVVNNLRTTLRLVLQELGFSSDEFRREQLDICLKRVPLSVLWDAEKTLDQALAKAVETDRQLSNSSMRNYRAALARFLAWLSTQTWYYRKPVAQDQDRAPKLSVRKGKLRYAENKRQREETLSFFDICDLEEISVEQSQLAQATLEQVSQFNKFWTTQEISLRKGPPMQVSTIEISIQGIYLLLGWTARYRMIKMEAISLEDITDLSALKSFMDYAVSERRKSYCWVSDVVKIAMLVAKFCNPHAKHYNYRDIPAVKVLRSYLAEIRNKREDIGHYSLRWKQFSDHLVDDWKSFEHFCLDIEVPERKTPEIGQQTFKNYREAIWGILGWLNNVKGKPIQDISLSDVADITILKASISYLINVRNTSYGRAVNFGYAAMAVAKWLNPQSQRYDFSDIDQVAAIRDYVGYLRRQHNQEEPRRNLDNKRLTFHEAQLVVEYLKLACAPLDKYGDERSQKAIMSCWQQYLIVAILTYCPVRQREIREMEIDKTLFREADGYWVKLKPSQHKSGKKSNKGREYPLPKHLSVDLDYWLSTFRSTVPTSHSRVFIRMGANQNPASRGGPLDGGDLSGLVSAAVQKATAVLFEEPRDTTPHVYRRIAVTFQRKYGRPEQREAFAELLGHSVKEADATYNEETLREKAQAAEDWWKIHGSNNKLQEVTDAILPQGWVADDKQELVHLGLSSRQNDYLRKARDRVVIALWAVQEFGWAELARANIGHFTQEDSTYSLAMTKPDGSISRVIGLKGKVGELVSKYIDAREECGEDVVPDAPLFIGIGNRSGGNRLVHGSLHHILRYHLGVT